MLPFMPRRSLDEKTVGRCQNPDCKKKIPEIRLRHKAKYCCKQCATRMANRRHSRKNAEKERARELARIPEPDRGKTRKGFVFNELEAKPQLVEMLDHGTVPHSYFAHLWGCSEADVSRGYAAYLIHREMLERESSWQPSWSVRAMLPVEKLLTLKALGPEGEGTPEFERLADELTRAYAVFSRFFFRLEGRRPLIKPFHLRWIRSIIVAYAIGGKQMILSPPRHGKSELLIRFSVWMICMFPNIRIMWVAANGDVSKLMLGAVKDHLEHNEELKSAVLPPGGSFRPLRTDNKPWSSKELKIRQQSHVGQKSSSMLSLGRTAKILSRDVDLLFTDDLEDFDTTRDPSQRNYSRNKLAEIGTRKEERTAWIYIASRQHPDDIPQHILRLEGTDQAWRVIVDSAHEDCQLDPDVIEGHDENGCVLFPEVRSYRWLMEKKGEMEALGIAGAYEMRYLNKPIPESGIVFHIDVIREKSLNRSRDLGTDGLPPGRLLAGIDPAARGTQAAFLWHYTNEHLSMVNLETQKAGGFAGALKLLEDWNTEYGVTHWFYEDNATQVEFFDDPRTKKLALELGLVLKPYHTQYNKTDPEIGISSMAPWYHSGRIDLPYGTADARQKVNMLLRQLELWTTDGVLRGRNRKTDIKMASWFPFPTVIKWGKADRQVRLQEEIETGYPGLGFTQAPWETTYPGV